MPEPVCVPVPVFSLAILVSKERRARTRARARLKKGEIAPNDAIVEISESVDKPGSVVDNHLSRMFVAKHLEQPTQTQYGSHY